MMVLEPARQPIPAASEAIRHSSPSLHAPGGSGERHYDPPSAKTPTQPFVSNSAGSSFRKPQLDDAARVHSTPHGSSLGAPIQTATAIQESAQQPPQNAPPPSPRLQPSHGSMLSLNGSAANSPGRIKVRDLSHIQSFASEEVLTRSRHPSRQSLNGRLLGGGQQYEISAMPVQDIIEMVAGLLTKITTTNDNQHEHLHRHIPSPDGSTGLSQQATSVLAFHGKNVPSITIASYLSRIHKYCPTTYEVFLSLLVYFDRMTEMVNRGDLPGFADSRTQAAGSRPGTAGSTAPSTPGLHMSHPSPPYTPPQDPSLNGVNSHAPNAGNATSIPPSISSPTALSPVDAYDISHYFVVDSFNIHRLVMAGVTCASKFFSDVFYTNSRYAKVCHVFPFIPLDARTNTDR